VSEWLEALPVGGRTASIFVKPDYPLCYLIDGPSGVCAVCERGVLLLRDFVWISGLPSMLPNRWPFGWVGCL
jgi:hypothetical protein